MLLSLIIIAASVAVAYVGYRYFKSKVTSEVTQVEGEVKSVESTVANTVNKVL